MASSRGAQGHSWVQKYCFHDTMEIQKSNLRIFKFLTCHECNIIYFHYPLHVHSFVMTVTIHPIALKGLPSQTTTYSLICLDLTYAGFHVQIQ